MSSISARPRKSRIRTDGIERKPTAGSNSAVWRAYYNPHGWWAEHQTIVREAHRRRAEASAKAAAVAPEVMEMIQACLNHIADLRFGLNEPAPPEPGSYAELFQRGTAIAEKLRRQNGLGVGPEERSESRGAPPS